MALASSRNTLNAFLLGLTTGVVYFTGTLYWITLVMGVYGGLPMWVAAILNGALIAYLALFPALFAIVMQRALAKFGARALAAAPLVWVASEVGRTYILTGFPWVLLGYARSPCCRSRKSRASLGCRSRRSSRLSAPRPRMSWWRSRDRLRPAAFVAGLLVIVVTWGSRRVEAAEWTRAGEPIESGWCGNVDQGQKWDPARAAFIFTNYLEMTRQAIARRQAVLWPESSTPFYFEEAQDRGNADRLRALAREARVPILIGSDQIEKVVPPKYFNSAFLVQGDGSTGGVYRKMHLVPFGEYVPFKRMLFFAAPLVEAVSDFSEGDQPALLPIDGHRISTSICYEIVYPNLVRQFVTGGSELLTSITNDAWFGKTSAPYQHFAQASMRAIENGRYLVRSANTGISGIVDPYGRVLERTLIYEPAVVVCEARFLRTTTVYARIGDVFAYASVAVTLALFVLSRRRVQ